MPPFVLGDRYDHEEACKHKFHVMGSYRNFLDGSEVLVVTRENSRFGVVG